MNIIQLYQKFLSCKTISTDTRKIESNVMFFALKGENFDANTFAQEALNKGASFVIIDNSNYYINEQTILVHNVLETLQELAKHHREQLGLPIIALTGSNGKTTTKELIHAVLSKKFITKATVGNLNNHIGVPLTLLSFTKETQIGIVEMGANHQKEIEFLCSIAKPDFGYITNFGKAHLEGFGGVEGVIKGKSEMYVYLRQNNKTAFVNLDDMVQIEKSTGIKSITFSTKNTNANYCFSSIVASPNVALQYTNAVINSNLIGIYNAINICAAITIGQYFEVNIQNCKQAIEEYVPTNNRSQVIEKETNHIILDAYNANPSSMLLAIENFIQLPYPKKIMVLGDMFELGNESHVEHSAIVEKALKNSTITCFFVGKHFYQSKKNEDNLHFFETFEDFTNYFKDQKFTNSYFLIKGSRGMALEKTLESL